MSKIPSPFPLPSEVPAVEGYSRVPDLFRSWFWRYYDHLFALLLINLGWSTCCFAAFWSSLELGFWKGGPEIPLWKIYVFFLAALFLSLGWAYWVFRIFQEGSWSWKDFAVAYRRFGLKAMGIGAVSGGVTLLALYNIHFYFRLNSGWRFLDLSLAGLLIWLLVFWVCAAALQWPLLFFQDPPFGKIYYRSILLVLGNGPASLACSVFLGLCFLLFGWAPFLWYFLGFVHFFSFCCVMLEKRLLRYKITFGDGPLGPFLEFLESERKRGWREIFRPWEGR